MKTITVTRKLDNLCRLVLPVDMRRAMGLGPRDEVEVTLRGKVVTIRKPLGVCPICRRSTNLMEREGICLCPDCMENMLALAAKEK